MLREHKIFLRGGGGGSLCRDFTFSSTCYKNIKYMERIFKGTIFGPLGKYTSLVSEMPKMRYALILLL